MRTHYDIKPIEIFLDENILLRNKCLKPKIISGKIIALDLYKDEAVSFTIVLENGSIFNYIPIDKVYWNKEAFQNIKYNLKDLVYHNSPSNIITIDEISFLKGKEVNSYLKYKKTWIKGKYICSIDWYEGNDLLNFIMLENGQFAFLPNHKILLLNGSVEAFKKFPDYEKLKCTNKV